MTSISLKNLTDRTYKLVEQVQDRNKKLIITTIQKMTNAIKKPKYQAIMEQYSDEKVIFIFDECHRSQFGKMHSKIKKFFKELKSSIVFVSRSFLSTRKNIFFILSSCDNNWAHFHEVNVFPDPVVWKMYWDLM